MRKPYFKAQIVYVGFVGEQSGACDQPLVLMDALEDIGVSRAEDNYREEELSAMIDPVVSLIPSCFTLAAQPCIGGFSTS